MEETRNTLGKLEEQLSIRNTAQLRIESLVKSARQEGKPWDAIGRALGMSKQAVWEKYRYLDKFLT
jgi:hypothetical protein